MSSRSIGCALLIAAASAPALAELPPLIDREQFFGDPEITAGQLSPDGKYIAFIKPFKGTRNIWVKETGRDFSTARPLTADTKRPIPQFFFSRDSRYILFVQDQAGDENYNVFAVDPAAKAPEGKDVPEARDLTGMKKVRAALYNLPKHEPDVIYVGFNDRDPAWHDLYRVQISTGQKTLMRKNMDRITGWSFDNAGKLRLATRTTDNGDKDVLRADEKGFTRIGGCTVLEECNPIHFDKQNERVYFESNEGDVDLTRLMLFDPKTGKEELVESDPEKRVDFGFPLFSEKSDELIGTVYIDDKPRYHFRDKGWKADYEFLQARFPGKDVSPGSITKDESLWLIAVVSDTEPGERWLFDRKTRKLTLEYRIRESLPRNQLASMKSIHYPSSDGLSIPAYLTLPSGVPAKALPLIVLPHGGPWGRTTFGYHSLSQFLANRGYAVLEPNFRASTGYGKKFIDAGNGQWGEKMQDDLTWGVKHLVAEGIADPKRIGIMGGSYGGYATLAGVAFTPDLYQAAVAIVAPSNLITLLETIPPYWEQIRKLFYRRMGDPTTPEGKAKLERQSPLNSAGKIKTPLMVVQGANDPRVNKNESDQIVVALRDRGFPVQYIVAPDEGHGFQRPINNLATFASAEVFLAKHLGGRAQTEMTPEIAARLKEIAVDPKTVTVKKKVDTAKVEAPKPSSDLEPRTGKYKAKLAMGANAMEIDMVHEIKEEDGAWVVIDTAKMPMGEMTDRTVLQKGSLLAIRRAVKQGPMSAEIEFAAGKATGKMGMNGNDKPIDADLGGPVFAEGNSEADAIARLPLEDGYTLTYRQFDLMRGKPAYKQLKVAGSESVTVPAGTFDTVKVEVAPTDGPGRATLWIDKATRRMVKESAVTPNGATLTTELQ